MSVLRRPTRRPTMVTVPTFTPGDARLTAAMFAPLDFYFDFTSPYGYFASTAIDSLAAKYGREVNWHPVLLGAIFKSTGAAPLPSIPVKGPYALKDIPRTARFHAIEFHQPTAFPIATVNAARAFYWVQTHFGAERAKELARHLFRAYFVHDHNIGDALIIAEVGAAMGLDEQALVEGMQNTDIKAVLRDETEEALARGVFGSPHVIVDSEPFWGFDRFDQIEAWLRDGKI